MSVAFLAAHGHAQQSAHTDDTAPTIVVQVNKVLIPVVVRNKQGHTVGNLRKEDFQVFDNDQLQAISSFSVERRAVTEAVEKTSDLTASGSAAAPGPAGLPTRFVLFLFDDLHLTPEDLLHSQKAGVQAIATVLTSSDMAAVFSLSGKINSGLTTDRGKLQQAVLSVKPQHLYRSSPSDCPYIPYYQANLIEDKHDSGALSEAIRQIFNCDPSLDRQRDIDVAQRLAQSTAMQVELVGHQDVQSTYAVIREVVRRMATLPGQRSIILVSPGFLTIEPDTLTSESQIIDLAANSNVTINTLDARGLYTTSMTASEAPASDPEYQSDIRRATMQADENPLAELADGTGGTFFHNNNDLNGGLQALAEAPEYLYMLEITPNAIKPDGYYHRLKVKVEGTGLRLQARHGYFVPNSKKTKK